MNAEEKVRRAWEDVEPEDHSQCCGPDEPFRIRLGKHHARWEGTWSDAWSAAAAFTDERLKQIAEIEEEIAALQPFADGRTEEALTKMPVWANDTVPALLAAGRAIQRTLARLQAIREELRRGMK